MTVGKDKNPPPPNNEWLRQGSTGPVPLGTSGLAGVRTRNLPPKRPEELVKMARATWELWKRGGEVHRAVAALRSATTVAMYDHKVPTDLQWISDFFNEASPLFEPFVNINIGSMGPGNHVTLNAALAYSILKCLEVSDTPSWFEIKDDFAHALLATKLKGVKAGDVKLPLPGFYIELPPGLMTLLNNLTGEHVVRAISVCEGVTSPDAIQEGALTYFEFPEKVAYGRRLLIMVYCDPNENSDNPEDDNLLYFSLPLYDDEMTIEDMLEHDREVAGSDWRDEKVGGTFAGVPRTNLQIRNVLQSFVVNFLIYLSSPEADVTHKHADRIRQLRKGKKRKSTRARQAVERLKAQPSWVVGSRVVVDPDVRESVRHAGTSRGPQKAVNVQVMGFWRRQWRGKKTPEKPKGQEWYWKWIKPFVRNKVEGQPVLGHEYKVKGDRSRK
jgi:hypothetical protein